MIRVNLSKKLLFYSKLAAQQNDGKGRSCMSVVMGNDVLSSYGRMLLSKNAFFNSNYVSDMMANLAQ